jgi:hypothetical protein
MNTPMTFENLKHKTRRIIGNSKEIKINKERKIKNKKSRTNT